ncbi:arsenate reductase ArsC [Candidatus Dependentiae bacterium]|nr:arsenate reductase ArsC [Candidatus Dependentiae bacterium]
MIALIAGFLCIHQLTEAAQQDQKRILVICVHNSARSVMLAKYLEQLHPDWAVYSAGLKPTNQVNPFAVQVLKEDGIDVSAHKPQEVTKFLTQPFDYVISVCEAECPVFSGQVKHTLHVPFQDPSSATGSKEEKLVTFRRVRDQIKAYAQSFPQ